LRNAGKCKNGKKEETEVKKNLFLVVAIMITMTSCMTSNPSAGAGGTNAASAKSTTAVLVKPADLVDKILEGKGGNTSQYDVTYIFKSDGTMTRTQNGIECSGTWKYDAKRSMRKYTLEWSNGSEKYGYIVDIILNDTEYNIMGDWFITDAYITLRDKVTEKK